MYLTYFYACGVWTECDIMEISLIFWVEQLSHTSWTALIPHHPRLTLTHTYSLSHTTGMHGGSQREMEFSFTMQIHRSFMWNDGFNIQSNFETFHSLCFFHLFRYLPWYRYRYVLELELCFKLHQNNSRFKPNAFLEILFALFFARYLLRIGVCLVQLSAFLFLFFVFLFCHFVSIMEIFRFRKCKSIYDRFPRDNNKYGVKYHLHPSPATSPMCCHLWYAQRVS